MHHDDTDMVWYVCNVWCRSLMCTSNVANNTQMASLERQVTQNGLGVINAMARENTMEGYHDTKMIWYICNGRYGSLLCTSNIAGNTQWLVSIGK